MLIIVDELAQKVSPAKKERKEMLELSVFQAQSDHEVQNYRFIKHHELFWFYMCLINSILNRFTRK